MLKDANPIIPSGYLSKYLYYKSSNQSQITVPRSIIEASNLNWKHGDRIFISFKRIEDLVLNNLNFDYDNKQSNHTWLNYKGLFLFKKKSSALFMCPHCHADYDIYNQEKWKKKCPYCKEKIDFIVGKNAN